MKKQTCSIDGCGNVGICGRDTEWGLMCAKHWARYKRHNDPHKVFSSEDYSKLHTGSKRSNSRIPYMSTTMKNGYVMVYAPEHPKANPSTGYTSQHRLVMEQHLGRLLTRDENVHHINGVRHDNRLENLELWSTSQPQGQRIEDKLAWAYEIIEKYGGKHANNSNSGVD